MEAIDKTHSKNIITGQVAAKNHGDLICNTCNILITKHDYFGDGVLSSYYQGIIVPCPLCCEGMHEYLHYKLTFNHPIREFIWC
jgi:hypothetical protein